MHVRPSIRPSVPSVVPCCWRLYASLSLLYSIYRVKAAWRLHFLVGYIASDAVHHHILPRFSSEKKKVILHCHCRNFRGPCIFYFYFFSRSREQHQQQHQHQQLQLQQQLPKAAGDCGTALRTHPIVSRVRYRLLLFSI